jgi:hypothetical protein
MLLHQHGAVKRILVRRNYWIFTYSSSPLSHLQNHERRWKSIQRNDLRDVVGDGRERAAEVLRHAARIL